MVVSSFLGLVLGVGVVRVVAMLVMLVGGLFFVFVWGVVFLVVLFGVSCLLW